jgi:hypothetical protein
VIPGARVTVTNIETGMSKSATADGTMPESISNAVIDLAANGA